MTNRENAGALPEPQVRDVRAVQRPPRNDRDTPLDTASARCLWHVDGTAGENDDAPAWRRVPARRESEAHPPEATASLASPEGSRQPEPEGWDSWSGLRLSHRQRLVRWSLPRSE
jgi:hypothetical protein